MGAHLAFCGRCNAVIEQGEKMRAHVDFHIQEDKKSAVRREIGNVLDRWEQLPNDIRSDAGFENLESALQKLNHAVDESSKSVPKHKYQSVQEIIKELKAHDEQTARDGQGD